MKKILTSITFAVILIFTLAVSVVAYEELPKVDEKEFSVASYHGTQKFFTDCTNPQAVEASTAWLIKNKNNFNLKYVSFLGNITGGGKYRNGVGGTSIVALRPLCASDEEWIKEFESLKPTF